MAKRKYTYDIRLISENDSYYVKEICQKLSVHKNTVREWQRHGLTLADDRKPYMFHGSVLREYLKNKQLSRKRKCKPDEFHCCRCRQPRRPYGGIVDITVYNKNLMNLSGLCEECDCPIYKITSVTKLAEISKIFQVQEIRNAHLLGDVPSPAESEQ